ncbi:MAG TPA: adenylate/guanylate cyclase domain-containing protein, partial [Oligoflexus sp.]|uniref:adenylate/guanylate cyclase domain-containing protein n=1 Tax=Oligoflexus sp. TaxID=1971216 RepID=UPI002D2CAAB8
QKLSHTWLRYRDMKGSTKLSASSKPKSTAKAYRLFTSTAVKMFHEIDARYIDVKGDGIFALFDSNQLYTALASAVSFKTFCDEVFVSNIRTVSDQDIGVHIGIDTKDVLVRKLGLKRKNERSDRQNEVWAGKPVNMAFKLASLSDGTIMASDRYHKLLKDEKSLFSCGCPNNEKTELWSEIDVSSHGMFDFTKAFSLKSSWCKTHGREFCEHFISLDANN